VFSKLASASGVVFVGMVAACSSHEVDTAPSLLSMAGNWTQGARLQDSSKGQTHIHTGSFSFAQEGDAFTGSGQQTGLCHGPSGDYVGPLATGALFQITNGVQQDRNVSFKSDLCAYTGVMSADGARIEGTVQCAYTDHGTSFVWTGDWLADRER